MKIDNSYNPALSQAVSNKTTNPRNTEKATVGSDSAAVKLSGLASSMSASSAENSAPVSSARIAELRAAISSGQFKINSSAIADRLLDTAKELVQTQRKA